jgi:hypothetical protein
MFRLNRRPAGGMRVLVVPGLALGLACGMSIPAGAAPAMPTRSTPATATPTVAPCSTSLKATATPTKAALPAAATTSARPGKATTRLQGWAPPTGLVPFRAGPGNDRQSGPPALDETRLLTTAHGADLMVLLHLAVTHWFPARRGRPARCRKHRSEADLGGEVQGRRPGRAGQQPEHAISGVQLGAARQGIRAGHSGDRRAGGGSMHQGPQVRPVRGRELMQPGASGWRWYLGLTAG